MMNIITQVLLLTTFKDAWKSYLPGTCKNLNIYDKNNKNEIHFESHKTWLIMWQ